MIKFMRLVIGMLAMLAAATVHGVQFAYEPVGLSWSADEIEHATTRQMKELTERAEQAQQLGCSRHCERLARVLTRIVVEARGQTPRSAALPWALTVVRLPDVDARAMPSGQVVISESFVNQRLQADETLAFVLAHEMAHSTLEHERQALTFARLMLPRHIARTVQDMYVEMDLNFSLLKAMEPVMQQGEFEADELGLLMASAAGYDPDQQLAFLEHECRGDTRLVPIVSTHPPPCLRLQALQELLPLARRQRTTDPG
jgi:predicted Zn-dependent protease